MPILRRRILWRTAKTRIDFQTEPSRYRHWKLAVDGDVATLTMDVDEKAGLFDGYELKLNSYDLGVDIELADAIDRLRFEYPQARVVVLRSGKPRVFCAGANIRMLAGASHAHKVNFCKFTNETRNGIEDLSANSGVKSICAINGTAAGGGYELALATDHIMLIDDGSAAVSLPELPLLAVLPGTGGLTRVSDKRKVRRDHADVFCTTEEGVKGKRAAEWRLVDDVVPGSKFDEAIAARAKELAAKSSRNGAAEGIKLTPLTRTFAPDSVAYSTAAVEFGRAERIATVTVRGPAAPPPASADAMAGARRRVLAADARPRTRRRHPAYPAQRARCRRDRLQVVRRSGPGAGLRPLPRRQQSHWLAREIRLLWKRVLKRVDLTSRSLVTLIEPGSCFAGTLAELPFAVRPLVYAGRIARGRTTSRPATLTLDDVNFGAYPMANGLTRLASRFLANPADVDAAKAERGKMLDAERAQKLGLVTFAPDDIDWDDEVRLFLEERASFSPDALTGLEANLRFAGPETMESKIFARLTAWQNWIFQRPNAIGEDGALKRYGTGQKPVFDTKRV